MVWAVLILLGVVVLVHWLEYRRSVQEYTFAQPGTLPEVRDVIGEKTPIVVEIGVLPWRPEVARNSAWMATVGEIGELEMPITSWMEENPRPPIKNGLELATEIGIENGLTDIDDSRLWWWMAGLNDTTVGVLERGSVKSLEWVTAERKWIGCTSGAPLLLWLAHSRYQRYLPNRSQRDCDPWIITSAETPWIGRVQYIEVRVKPGWAIAIPAHWGYAMRPEGEGGASWWWSTTQHSPLSRGLTRLQE